AMGEFVFVAVTKGASTRLDVDHPRELRRPERKVSVVGGRRVGLAVRRGIPSDRAGDAVIARVFLLLIMMAILSHGAFAQNWFVSPMVGSTFHPKTGFVDLENATEKKKLSIGVGGGRFIGSRFGVEGEVAWLPGFFNGDGGLVHSSRVVTTSGNVLVQAPIGKLRP